MRSIKSSWWLAAVVVLIGSLAADANEPSWSWTGALTTDSVVISTGWAAAQPGPVQVSADPNLPDARTFNAQTSDGPPIGTIGKYAIDGLEPNTPYYYGWHNKVRGRFHTFAKGQASFTFGFASCAGTGSKSPGVRCDSRAQTVVLHSHRRSALRGHQTE